MNLYDIVIPMTMEEAKATSQRLDPKCWKGKHKEGTKVKGGVRVNNCVPNESVEEGIVGGTQHVPAEAEIKKIIWDTLRINEPTAKESVEAAITMLSKRPKTRMVQQLMGHLKALSDRAHLPLDPFVRSVLNHYNESVAEDSWHGEGDAWGGQDPWTSGEHEMVEGRLTVGDPVIVTAPNEFEGKTGEIAEFSPSGKFVIVNLYNHGEHSMHLSDVEYNQHADEEDEMDEGYAADIGLNPKALDPASKWKFSVRQLIADYIKNPQGLYNLAKQKGANSAEYSAYNYIMNPTGKIPLPPNQQGVTENSDSSPVTGAITRRILSQRLDLLKQYGPELVGAAVDNVADYVGDVEEIGSSDVSAWVAQVERMLKENPPEAFSEGFQDFNKVEPYAVCLAGKPVKKFDYYEQARRFHDNWKQKLYREGNKAKADKITLMPLNLDEMDKSQTPPGRAGDYPLGVKGTMGKPVTAKKVVKDLTKDLDQAFGKEKKVKEEAGRVDPILIKALNRMPDGLASHGEVLNACYDAYAMELGRMEMKSNYGTTHAYVPQLMDLYKQKHGLTFKEAANPAQQAAIAIAMKKAGKKPEQVDEFAPGSDRGDDEVPDQILKLANRWWNAGDKQPQITSVLRSLGWTISQVESEDDAVQMTHDDGTTYFISADDFDPEVFEDTGSWIVYDPETKQIKKRFKTHTAGKSYAQTHNLGFASSEYYFDNIKERELTETALNPRDPRGDYAAKRKALQDLGMNKDVDQAAVLQRRLDLDKEADAKGVAEAETDFSKRRKRERDVDAGRPVKPVPKNSQTDYARKRARDRKEMELGESYWTKLQRERSTKLNTLVNELKETIK